MTAAMPRLRPSGSALNIAVIGAGEYCLDFVIPTLQTMEEEFSIKAVWSRTREHSEYLSALCGQDKKSGGASSAQPRGQDKLQQAGGKRPPSVYFSSTEWGPDVEKDTSLESLLDRTDITAVVLLVPVPIAPILVRKILRAKKCLWSSKPIAPTIGIAKQLFDDYLKSPEGVVWSVSEPLRYESAFTKLKLLVPELGNLYGATLTVGRPADENDAALQDQRRYDREEAGGLLLNMALPWIGVLRKVLGEVQSAISTCSKTNPEFGGPDTITGALFFDKGVSATVHISASSGMSSTELTVTGDQGRIVVKDYPGGGGFSLQRHLSHYEHPMFHPNTGLQFSLQSWAEAIRGEVRDDWTSPIQAVTDLIVTSAFVNSRGAPVTFKEKAVPRRKH